MGDISFKEQIAAVNIQDDGRDFGSFFGVKELPVTFELTLSINFLNLIVNQQYNLHIEIARNQNTDLEIRLTDNQSFTIPEANMIFVKNGYGHCFVTTKMRLDVQYYGEYCMTLKLQKDGETLSSFRNFYYFGESNG